MSLPEPEPGLVIRYSYLWLREHEAGKEEGSKDRPCAIVINQFHNVGQNFVVVVPITHSPPLKHQQAIEIPYNVKQHLGLDSDRSWIVIEESNVFRWPGPDLARDQTSGKVDYGFLPPRFFDEIRRKFVLAETSVRSTRVVRTE